MNKIGITALAALVLVAGCRKKAEDGQPIPAVNVAAVTTDSVLLHKDFPGVLQARAKADVVGEVSGKLLTKNFESGSYVTKGQVLFTIESTKYRDAVQQAQASLTTAQSQRDFYASQSAAMQKAFDEDAVSKMELLQSQTSLRSAEASIQNARAALESAQTKLAKCTVRAPISGYITMNDISVGNYVNGEVSPQTLATIYDNSVLDAVFSIGEDEYQQLIGSSDSKDGVMFRNMPLTFATPPKTAFAADLYYVAPSVSSSTGTLQLVGSVRNVDNQLRDGMYVTVSLPYGTDAHALLVKDASLSTDQLGKYLYVVNDSNRVVYTPVTVGPSYRDSLRVIEKGVKAGDLYVTRALLTVRNGMEVKPVR